MLKRIFTCLFTFTIMCSMLTACKQAPVLSTDPTIESSAISDVESTMAPTSDDSSELMRAQKDDSQMNQMSSQLQLALADIDVYNELLSFVCEGNVSSYIDVESEDDYTKERKMYLKSYSTGKSYDMYRYLHEVEMADQTTYYAAGNMRGVTITFQPQDGKFILSDAIINKFVQPEGNRHQAVKESTNLVANNRPIVDIKYYEDVPNYNEHGTLSSNGSNDYKIYSKLVEFFGEEVELSSATYANSEYTIFVMVPPGNVGVVVYGQWNGTNLPN